MAPERKVCVAAGFAATVLAASMLPAAAQAPSAAQPAITSMVELGRALFGDRNLSVNRRQLH